MEFKTGNWTGITHSFDGGDDLSVIDCSAVDFAEPVLITAIAAIAQRAKTQQRTVRFVKPRAEGTALYLSRMHVHEILDELDVIHDFEPGNERDQSGRLIELHKFRSEHDGETLAGMICDRVRDAGGVNPQTLEELFGAISELATNTALHADTPHGYAAAQTYPNKKEIRFSIADAGIGFYASLSKNPALKPDDDAHALDLATVRQMSGTGEQYRGYGLPDVVSSVRRLGGSTRIASGRAAATFSNKHEEGQVKTVTSAVGLRNPYTGVIVDVTIPWEPGR